MGELTKSELIAIEIALDELISYVATIGADASLDDEEMPDNKLNWAIEKLTTLVDRERIRLG
jgi:hypothetical protein